MCGRFTLRTSPHRLSEHFACPFPEDLAPRYNIAPSQPVLAVRRDAANRSRQSGLLRWGLVPFWAKDPAIGNRLINARSETVAEKPAFRAAFRHRRCILPADGYYEWQKTGGRKQPYRIRLRDEVPFGLAGLWETWEDPATGQTLESCTILTTEANRQTRPIHDRMPVILPPAEYDAWLDPELKDSRSLLPLLQPFAADRLALDPVSTVVNNPRNDVPECIQPRD